MNTARTILGLDTATTACSAAVWRRGRILAGRFEPMARGQAERLLPLVREVLGEAGCGFEDLNAIAVTIGPGAFTGLRIGLAAARAMGLAAGLPVVGVTTFQALLRGVPDDELTGRAVLAVLDTKRADVYAQAFHAEGTPMGDPAAVTPDGLPALVPPGLPVLTIGDKASMAARVLREQGVEAEVSRAPAVPDAAHVAAIAGREDIDGKAPSPVPLYLRPPDARPAADGGRLRP